MPDARAFLQYHEYRLCKWNFPTKRAANAQAMLPNEVIELKSRRCVDRAFQKKYCFVDTVHFRLRQGYQSLEATDRRRSCSQPQSV